MTVANLHIGNQTFSELFIPGTDLENIYNICNSIMHAFEQY